jgi:hypothetical protein
MEAVPFPRSEGLNYTVEGYMEKVKRGYWKLHYIQRNDDTWPEEHYRELIVSIFNNILTSPFIGSAKSELDVTILDGGHRTEAMRRFMDGMFRIKCPTTGADVLYNELTENDRAIFKEKPLIMLIYPELTPLQEEKIFFRVNNSLSLSPGELINGYMSIPICVLARELGERFSDSMRASFKNCIGVDARRADASNVMLLILRNFQMGRLVVGEIPTEKKKEELKRECEKLRAVEIDKRALTRNVEILFDIAKNRSIEDRYLLMVLPTIQGIMLKHNAIGMTEQRLSELSNNISEFFFEIEDRELHPKLNIEYQRVMRTPKDPTIKCCQNPSIPLNCNKRIGVFQKWLKERGRKI